MLYFELEFWVFVIWVNFTRWNWSLNFMISIYDFSLIIWSSLSLIHHFRDIISIHYVEQYSVCMDGALDVNSHVGGTSWYCGEGWAWSIYLWEGIVFCSGLFSVQIEALASRAACNIVLEQGSTPIRFESVSLPLAQAMHSIHDCYSIDSSLWECPSSFLTIVWQFPHPSLQGRESCCSYP